MGIVWRAHDELLDRIVAVKESATAGSTRGRRVDLHGGTQKARPGRRPDHPSVVIVHDVVEDESRPWIVMQ